MTQPPQATPPTPATYLTLRDHSIRMWSSPDYQGPRARKMWLPAGPMLNPTAVDKLIERTKDQRAHMSVPCGIIDLPFQHKQLPWIVNLSGATTSMALGGAKNMGKTNFCETFIVSGAMTHHPNDLQFFCLDFSSQRLTQLEYLPHVIAVGTRNDMPHVRRIINELEAVLLNRQKIFSGSRGEKDPARRIPDWAAYLRIRANIPEHPAAKDPYGDIVFIMDGYDAFKEPTWVPSTQVREHDRFIAVIKDLLRLGPGFGIHAIFTTTKWSAIRGDISDNLPLKVDLKPADDSDVGATEMEMIRMIRTIPKGTPGRALSTEGKHIMIGAPRLDGHDTCLDVTETYPATIEAIERQWPDGPKPPKLEMLPSDYPLEQLLDKLPLDPSSATRRQRWQIPIGLAESDTNPVLLDMDRMPNVLIFGASPAGKTTTLRAIAKAITSRNSPRQVQFMTVDLRGQLTNIVAPEYIIKSGAPLSQHATPGAPTGGLIPEVTRLENLSDTVGGLANALNDRQINGVGDRPDIVVLVDNWHLLATTYPEGMRAFSQAIMSPESRFHFIATCTVSAMSNAIHQSGPAFGAAWAIGSHSLILSGEPEHISKEFTIIKRPPGQALYLKDKSPVDVLQIGNVPDPNKDPDELTL